MTNPAQFGLRRDLSVRDRVSEVYGRFYGPLAVVSLVISFFPLFDPVIEEDSVTEYGSVYDMAARSGGEPAVIAIVLMVALIVALAVATIRARWLALPLAITILAALIVTMLLTKPGTGTPTPDLSGPGRACLALAIAIVGLGVAHTVHLNRIRPVIVTGRPWTEGR